MSAIANAILLIQKTIAHQAEGVNFTELNEGTNIPQGSAHRIVKELVALKVLDYDHKRKTYRGGLMLAALGAQVLEHYSLRDIVRPRLETLHSALGHIVTLGIRNGAHGIYIDRISGSDMRLRLHSEIGKAFPLHCTAMGKVLLAYADEDVQRSVLQSDLPAITPNTITDPARLEKELATVKDQGYALDNEEITRGLICTAAPIFGVGGEVVGAISFTCQKHTFEELGLEVILERVVETATQSSA